MDDDPQWTVKMMKLPRSFCLISRNGCFVKVWELLVEIWAVAYIYIIQYIQLCMYIIIYEVGACIDVSYTYKDRERETIQHRMCIWSWYVEILQMYIHLLSRYNLFIYVYWCTWYWHGLYHKHLCYTSTYAAPLDGIHTRSFNVAMENHNFQ